MKRFSQWSNWIQFLLVETQRGGFFCLVFFCCSYLFYFILQTEFDLAAYGQFTCCIYRSHTAAKYSYSIHTFALGATPSVTKVETSFNCVIVFRVAATKFLLCFVHELSENIGACKCGLSYPTNSPKPKDVQFTLIYVRGKQQIVFLKETEPENIWHTCQKND